MMKEGTFSALYWPFRTIHHLRTESDIAGDNRSCTEDGTITSSDAREKNRTSTYPNYSPMLTGKTLVDTGYRQVG
jgi:hypothetical protein